MKNKIRKFIPPFLINWYHLGLAFLGAVLYLFPSRNLIVIGVTGTNGKSTVVDFITKILEEAGFNVASISSIRFKIDEEEKVNNLKMTMPGRFKIQRFLREAINKDCHYAVLEVTSEGILQHRHRFIDFDVAVFTNLTPEHIESHGSFENYKKAKGKLFEALEKSRKKKKFSIINLDDDNTNYFLGLFTGEKIGYSINSPSALKPEKIEVLPERVGFTLKDVPFQLKLPGKFNIYNALAAIAVGFSQGIGIESSRKALERIKKVPGRMEEVISSPFKVFVDYAHTPDALINAYSSFPKEAKKICVLGSCGGGRDKWKRLELGKIADKFCNQIILTNEDPYDENPDQIISQVESGIERKDKVLRIIDRKEAIKKALGLADPGDIVIITGKGSEPWMCVEEGKKIPWSDKAIVKDNYEKALFSKSQEGKNSL